MSTLIPVGIVAAVLVAAFAVVFRKLLQPSGNNLEAWRIGEFSISSYRPLSRLLSEDDYLFLREQEGYEPAMEKQLRAERRRIAWAYLSSLSQDFHTLHVAARLLLVQAPTDQPELAAALARQSYQFWMSLTIIRARLAWNALGIRPVEVDFSTLLAPANWMQVQLQGLAQPVGIAA